MMTDGIALFTDFMNSPDFTLSLWFNLPSSKAAPNTFYEVWGESPVLNFGVQTQNSGSPAVLNLADYYLGPQYSDCTYANSLQCITVTLDTWHHVVLRHQWSSNNLDVFFDGQLQQTLTWTRNDFTNYVGYGYPGQQTLGAQNYQSYPYLFPGSLDEVWLFRFRVPDYSIASLYTSNTLLVCPTPGTQSTSGDGTFRLGCQAVNYCPACPMGSYVPTSSGQSGCTPSACTAGLSGYQSNGAGGCQLCGGQAPWSTTRTARASQLSPLSTCTATCAVNYAATLMSPAQHTIKVLHGSTPALRTFQSGQDGTSRGVWPCGCTPTPLPQVSCSTWPVRTAPSVCGLTPTAVSSVACCSTCRPSPRVSGRCRPTSGRTSSSPLMSSRA